MKHISYYLTSPQEWHKQLHTSLPSTIHGNQFLLDPSFGEGKLNFLKVQKGLWAQQLEFLIFEGLELDRLPSKKNDFYIIDFYLSTAAIETKVGDQYYSQSFQNVNMVLSSSMTSSFISIPAGKKVKIFNVLFTKEWLLNNVLVDYKELNTFFKHDHPIYLAENLDYKLKDYLKNANLENNHRLTSIATILQIIDYLFSSFKTRNLSTSNHSKIHAKDLDSLLSIRERIETTPQEMALLDDLAKSAGMSLSKFKRLFKQVFGTTPYKYHLKNKMEMAMETLQQGNYSVSETGFVLGYSNLSQFSKAFKNHYGLLPSEVVM